MVPAIRPAAESLAIIKANTNKMANFSKEILDIFLNMHAILERIGNQRKVQQEIKSQAHHHPLPENIETAYESTIGGGGEITEKGQKASSDSDDHIAIGVAIYRPPPPTHLCRSQHQHRRVAAAVCGHPDQLRAPLLPFLALPAYLRAELHAAVGRSPCRLAQVALTIGADRARSCSADLSSSFCSQGGSVGAVKDGAQTLRDAEERLCQSEGEMTRRGRVALKKAGAASFALSSLSAWVTATRAAVAAAQAVSVRATASARAAAAGSASARAAAAVARSTSAFAARIRSTPAAVVARNRRCRRSFSCRSLLYIMRPWLMRGVIK